MLIYLNEEREIHSEKKTLFLPEPDGPTKAHV
jgi:hypothetical protein